MANVYKHGAYAELETSIAQNAVQAGTVAVYVGVAPVNLVQGYADAEIVNLPVKINNFTDAQKKIGYSDDWTNFTLGEAVAAHFDNGLENIGPIYCINVLDPNTHKKTEPTNTSITFTNNVAEFASDKVILDTISIESYVKDTDFKVDYNFTTGKVIITSLNEELKGTVTTAYYEVDLTKITEETIIGGVTADGAYSGLGALQLLYIKENQVCNLLGCPKYSEIPEVYAKMISACQEINGHWQSFFVADIPIVDADGTKVDTKEKAKTWRTTNGYNSERSEIFWPQFQDVTTKRIFHGSTLAIVTYMKTDFEHDSIPFESCSNKEVPIGKQYFGADSTNQGFDQATATADLNAYGISTAVFWGGKWVLWGGNTAKYQYGKDIDPRAIDCHYMRMLFHCMNGFQRRQAVNIDEPFNLQLKDSILNEEQEILDTYIAQGGLLPGSEILFLASDNSTSDMINGDFVFQLPISVTPRAKSLTGKVAYTDAGLKSLVVEEA